MLDHAIVHEYKSTITVLHSWYMKTGLGGYSRARLLSLQPSFDPAYLDRCKDNTYASKWHADFLQDSEDAKRLVVGVSVMNNWPALQEHKN